MGDACILVEGYPWMLSHVYVEVDMGGPYVRVDFLSHKKTDLPIPNTTTQPIVHQRRLSPYHES